MISGSDVTNGLRSSSPIDLVTYRKCQDQAFPQMYEVNDFNQRFQVLNLESSWTDSPSIDLPFNLTACVDHPLTLFKTARYMIL